MEIYLKEILGFDVCVEAAIHVKRVDRDIVVAATFESFRDEVKNDSLSEEGSIFSLRYDHVGRKW